MNPRRLPLALLSFVLSALALPDFAAESPRALFNGRDLSGWSGNQTFWSVRDGAITGRTTPENPLKANTFIVWQDGEVADFEFRAKFRLLANNDKNSANSGVQYRSHVIDASAWIVGGYQADMDAANHYTGMLYEERGRGILARPGEQIQIGPLGADGKPQLTPLGAPTDPVVLRTFMHAGDWNELVIIAEGNHLRHFVNGQPTADVIDTDATKGAKAGVLALQLHTGPPMTIQFKEIFLKVLAP